MTVLQMDVTTQAIVVDETLPHSPATVWRVLTDGTLMSRWMMPPDGFEPVVGTAFTFQTTAAGAWDGLIRCEVLEVEPQKRLSYSWRGGHSDNVGYGSQLDTEVTWILSEMNGGTRLRLVHSGFLVPRNNVAYRNMSTGWTKVIKQLGDVTGGQN